MLKPVPLFGLGVAGKSVNVNAQERLNLYVQIEKDPEKNVTSIYNTPGLSYFQSLGSGPNRGIWQNGDYMYVVNSNTFYRVANDGTYVDKGTLLTSSGRVDITDNGLEIIVVDGQYGYIYNILADTFTQISDPDFPVCNTVTYLNGYFVVTKVDSGEFYISGLYDGTSWDALDFATAESDPDNLVRVMAENGQLILFGKKTTEFWGDSGAQDFPFSRVGASAIEWGLAARWSACKFMDSLMFLRKNRLGQVQICRMQGYVANPVSTPELEYVISQYSNLSNATAFTYMISGNPFYQINFDDVSWLYNGQSDSWSKLESGGSRHRAEMQINYLDTSYVTDYEDGRIYTFSQDVYTDDGEPIVREMICRHQSAGESVKFGQLWIEMETGVGLQSGQGSDPQIMMSVSRDGGHTWGPEVWRSMGAVGKYRTRCIWNRCGISRDWLYKFRISDPVKTVFVAAWAKYGG